MGTKFATFEHRDMPHGSAGAPEGAVSPLAGKSTHTMTKHMRIRCLWLPMGALLLCSCDWSSWLMPRSQQSGSTEIQLTTDHVAGVEFTHVSAQVRTLRDGQVVRNVEWEVSYGSVSGATIGTLHGLERGVYELCLRLRGEDGRVINQGCAEVVLADHMKVPFFLTQSCKDILCPGPNDDESKTSCVAGRCVAPACVGGLDAPGCDERSECTQDGECQRVSECAQARCIQGICISESAADTCGPDQWCNPAPGGACADFPTRTTITNGSCGDICTPNALPCLTGYVSCSSGENRKTCDELWTLPPGTPCEGDKVCDENAVCGACQEGMACDTGDPCTEGRMNCETMECVAAPAPAGTLCGDGTLVCDGAGTCGACEEGMACGETDVCSDKAMNCATLTCESTLKEVGLSCGDNGKVCQTDGACDTCEEGQPCKGNDGCGVFVQQCDGEVIECALQSAEPAGTSCNGGMGECNGQGRCREYLQASRLAVGGPSVWYPTVKNCAVLPDGTVACWGTNRVAERIEGLRDIEGVARNVYHSCAWDGTERVYCWGQNNMGQLGSGTVSNSSTTSTEVVTVSLPEDIDQVSVSIGSTCALGDSGTVYCWGQNTRGQVADGTIVNPRLTIHTTSVTDGSSLFASQHGFCVIRDGGGISCWGEGFYGQIGNATRTTNNPNPMNSLITSGALMGATGLELGNCAIVKAGDGKTDVRCWGYPNYCSLGNGQVSYPAGVSPGTPQSTTPRLDNAVQIGGSYGAVAVRLKTGKVMVWGVGYGTGLGPGNNPDVDTFGNECARTPTELPIIDDARDLNGHCAVRSDDSVWCWNLNQPRPVLLSESDN